MRKIERVFCTAGAILGALSAGTAIAQDENPTTPGAIPNPGTYQGSMQQQQQSDQQDQQFRQQQQAQQPQYVPQSSGQYRSGTYGGGNQPQGLNVHDQCFLTMSRLSSLAALRGLVELGTDTQDPRYFTISRHPTATESTALMRWRADRQHCNQYTSHTNAAVQQADLRAGQITNNMIVALAQGQMTYGEFNYRRAQNTAALHQFMATH
jgi:hypothetical protein